MRLKLPRARMRYEGLSACPSYECCTCGAGAKSLINPSVFKPELGFVVRVAYRLELYLSVLYVTFE